MELVSLLTAFLTNGICNVAELTQAELDAKERRKLQTEDEIRTSVRKALEDLLPKIIEKIPSIEALDREERQALEELFERRNELVYWLRETIVDKITMLSPLGHDEYIDMFSVEEVAGVIREIQKVKPIEGLRAETVNVFIPHLIILLLQGLGSHPKLKELFELIRSIQSARIQHDLHKILTLDDKEKLNAINSSRQTLYHQASKAYAIKLAGKKPDLLGRFDYLPPGLRRVKRPDGKIPNEFENEDNTEPISMDEFFSLLLNKKRVLLVAGAGVGKTTFLRRLHLELLSKRLQEAPLPIFQETHDFLKFSGDLFGRVTSLLEKSDLCGLIHDKATSISRELNKIGRLCFLVDSMDQSSDMRGIEQFFHVESAGHIERNIVVVACRTEEIHSKERLKDNFGAFEWVILDRFTEKQLKDYLGEGIRKWLNYDGLPENFRELLQTRFYANITRRIGLRAGSKRIETQADLLNAYIKELFEEARSRGKKFSQRERTAILTFLYRLSFDTLSDGHRQWFPSEFLDKYESSWKDAYDIIFNQHWIFFSSTVFEGCDSERYTFYHQLLQEYFTACHLKKLFETDVPGFEQALANLPFSEVVWDLLDGLLTEHKKVFDFCMDRIYQALAEADAEKEGLADKGDKFTWLLALRDRKGKRPELGDELQRIFDEEREVSQREAGAESDGKFVKVPAGAFLMGGYEYGRERPVRVVYLSDYWISRYAETFEEYDRYSEQKPNDSGWGRGRMPVMRVSWEDAKEYIKRRGDGCCLPTEAQWEKAARGCLGRKYPWGNEWDKSKANSLESEPRLLKTIEVESHKPEMYGLYQMSGNVEEWCEDWYGDYPSGSVTDPAGPSSGSSRVYRGGSWFIIARGCRSANRFGFGPGGRDDVLGFRLARTT